ncbi:MAG: T9SS type A sorting domain-containing protein [Prolixibacteraceae bacterium]|nr:T9SS type A sorting domain-containing protein [Prolixibacteraceae bacterium]
MRTILTLLFIGIFNLLFSQNTPQIDWQFGMLGNDLGEAGIIAEDIDNNGSVDIISTGRYSNDSWEPSDFLTRVEFDKDQNTYITRRISNIINQEIQCIQLYDFDQDGTKELYVGLDNGTVAIYNSKSLTKQRLINVSYRGKISVFGPANNIDCIEFGDINNDSSIDLNVTNGDTTYVLNNNFELILKIPYGSKYFKIGNIDNDSKNELLYSNGKIIQLNENQITEKYDFYTANKNTQIGLSEMNGDGILDVVYSSKDTMYIYDFKSNQLIWSEVWKSDYYSNRYITGLWLYDYDGDNIADIFIGDVDWDALYCYNGKTGAKDFSFRDNQGDGVVNIAIADFDNDANPEVIWSTGAGCTCADYFFLYDISTKSKEWQSRHYLGDFKAFDVGDVDNDNNLKIVSGVFGEYLKYYDHGFITVFNAESKQIEWQNDEEIFGAHVEDFTNVKIGDIDNDGENELLLGIEYAYSSSYVYVFDSQYKVERSFSIDGMSIIIDMEISDIDNDNKNELIITSGTDISGSTDPDEWQNYIYIFDGETGDLEWKSEQLAAIGSKIGSLNVGNIDGDDAKEIVALKYQSSWWSRDTSIMIIIDGISHEVIKDKSRSYTALGFADINSDGQHEIVAAVDTGKIEIINGSSLETIENYSTTCGIINGLKAYDMNNDGKPELVISDSYTISLYDLQNNQLKWQSDTLNSLVGIYNSLFVGNIDSDSKIEILINANHGIFSFEADYESISNIESVDKKHENSVIRIYPNPVIDKFTLEFVTEIPKSLHVKIYDINGRMVKENQYQNITNGVDINISELKSGLYNILIIGNNKIISSEKIIKAK